MDTLRRAVIHSRFATVLNLISELNQKLLLALRRMIAKAENL
jgi:hypothetical protein